MNITLKYFGQLRLAAGTEFETIECGKGASLRDAIKKAAEEHGGDFALITLGKDDAIHPSLIVLVNDAGVDRDSPVALKENDTITLLPAIAGG